MRSGLRTHVHTAGTRVLAGKFPACYPANRNTSLLEKIMPKPRRLNRFWFVALLLAWLFDQLFWGQSAGANFPLWVLLVLLALFSAAWWEDRRPSWSSYLLAIATFVLSLTPFLRGEPFSLTLSILLSLGGLGYLAATLLNGNWLFYRIGDHLFAWLKLVAAGIVRAVGGSVLPKPASSSSSLTVPPPDPTAGAAPATPLPAHPQRTGSFWHTLRRSFPFLRGILLALPILFILGSLLAAADPDFDRAMRELLRIFDLAKLPEYLFRLFYILIFAYVFVGLLLHAVLPESMETRPNPDQPWAKRFLGSTECFIILGSVLALFTFFIILQFRYLFGGQANIHETGFTYSEYARRGFFELVWVAVLSLGLLLLLGAFTRRPTASIERAFGILSMLLITLVLLMLASSLQRLMLYEAAYGFTRLRTYTHILIPWLALLLLAALILHGRHRTGRMGLAIFLTIYGFGLTFTFLNVDALVASLNIRRALAGAELDPSTLAELSADAVPVLSQGFRQTTPGPVRDHLGAALACHWIRAGAGTPLHPGWRSYDLSSARASRELAALDLSPYLVRTSDMPSGWKVKHQYQGAEFYCPYYIRD
jgi:hypothetical protein